jgi:hypothetical protein
MTDDPFDQPIPAGPSTSDDAAYSFDGKPDRWKRYRLPHPVTGTAGGYTRVSTFAKTLANTFSLNLYAVRMGGKGLTMRPDLFAAVAATPLSEKQELNRLMDQAKEAAGSKTGSTLGKALHKFAERLDLGEITLDEVPETWRPDLVAYRKILDDFGFELVPDLIERIVFWERFSIAGTFDRMVRVTKTISLRMLDPGGSKEYTLVTLNPGDLVDLDLKTRSEALEYGWLEMTVQQTAYNNAEHVFDKASKTWSPMPVEVRKDVALILHLPVGKGTAELFAVNTVFGVKAAQLCEAVREINKAKGLSTPLAVEEAGEVRDVTLSDRIAAATSLNDLSSIRKDAMKAKTWTPAVERLAIQKRDSILADAGGA